MRREWKQRWNRIGSLVLSALLLAGSSTEYVQAAAYEPFFEEQEADTQEDLETPGTGFIPPVGDTAPSVHDGKASALFRISPEAQARSYRTSVLPAIRDQGKYGVCWAFSTLGCMEINLMKKGYSEMDLSELHLAYFAYHSAMDPLGGFEGDSYTYTNRTSFLQVGGNYLYASNALMDWLGAADESVAPYEKAAEVEQYGLSSDLAYVSTAHLQGTRQINMADTMDVKQAIVDYGSVQISYYALTNYNSNSYYNADTAGYYCYHTRMANHAVVVVGWDDDYSASNFPAAPEGDGAWIVRNSWGPNYGEEGYFYLSYYDKTLWDVAVAYDAEPGDNYDYNYQYDGSLSHAYYETDNPNTAYANVFQSVAAEERIEAVSFETAGVNQDFIVRIYRNLTDLSNPESGDLCTTVSGRTTYVGAYTVPLENPVNVKAGENYSVVVQTGCVYFDISDMNVSGICDTVSHAGAKQSFANFGDGWRDLGAEDGETNFCIKAYTTLMSDEPAVQPDTGDTSKEDDKDKGDTNKEDKKEDNKSENEEPSQVGDLTCQNGKYYFYENGVMAASKEAYVNGAWRWFDADGTMAVDKDVYLTSSGGKWVRYNENGEMIKGEDYRYGGWYYFEPVTGTMMKGPVVLEDGRKVFYDTVNGQMLKGKQVISGETYYFDETDGRLISGNGTLFWVYADGKDYWYEDWTRQGWDPANEAYRGKEIWDPATDAWYWLDNVQQGAKAVSKDVYQESYSAYPDRADGTGKWVRYDANGQMIKGWQHTDAGIYYFEQITGAMAKGTVTIDGVEYTFDRTTGIRQ